MWEPDRIDIAGLSAAAVSIVCQSPRCSRSVLIPHERTLRAVVRARGNAQACGGRGGTQTIQPLSPRIKSQLQLIRISIWPLAAGHTALVPALVSAHAHTGKRWASLPESWRAYLRVLLYQRKHAGELKVTPTRGVRRQAGAQVKRVRVYTHTRPHRARSIANHDFVSRLGLAGA